MFSINRDIAKILYRISTCLIAVGLLASCSSERDHSIELENGAKDPINLPPAPSLERKDFLLIQNEGGPALSFILKSGDDKGQVIDPECKINEVCEPLPDEQTKIQLIVKSDINPRTKVVDWGKSANCLALDGTCDVKLSDLPKLNKGISVLQLQTKRFSLLNEAIPSMEKIELEANKNNSYRFGEPYQAAKLAIPSVIYVTSKQQNVASASRKRKNKLASLTLTLKNENCLYYGEIKSKTNSSEFYLSGCRDRITSKVIALKAPKANEVDESVLSRRYVWWSLPNFTYPESLALTLKRPLLTAKKGRDPKSMISVELPVALIEWSRPQ